MGKVKLPKKKNPKPKASEMEIKRAARQIKNDTDKRIQSMKNQIYSDVIKCVYPVAESNAFMRLMYCALMVYRDVDGYGKQRLMDRGDKILSQYECILSGNVTAQEMSDEIFKITGHRFEISDEDVIEQITKNAVKMSEREQK